MDGQRGIAMAGVEAPSRYRFGGLEFDARSGEVLKAGARLRLARQPAIVLTMLLERGGEVVTRDELRAHLWPADTFVDFEHGLNAAVNRIREVLGDTAHHPRLIETLPRRGYRMMVPVEPLVPSHPAVVPSAVLRTPASSEIQEGLELHSAPPAPSATAMSQFSPAAPVASRVHGRWFRGIYLAATLGILAVALSLVALWVSLSSRNDRALDGKSDRPATSSAAMEACDKGWQQLSEGSPAGLDQSMEYFQRAIELAPGLASAHAGLAESQALAVWGLHDPPLQRRETAVAAAARANELDSSLAEVPRATALVKWIFEWDWAGAEASFRRALAIAPDDERTLRAYCTFLRYSGRHTEAEKMARRELVRDPLSTGAAIDLVLALIATNRHAEALDVLRRLDARGLETARLVAFKAMTLASAGACADAPPALNRAMGLSGRDADDQVLLVVVGWAAAMCGDGPRANASLRLLRQVARRRWTDPGAMALVHAALGEREAALALLERAVEDRSTSALSMAHDPMLASLRGDARFEALVRRVGAPGRRD